MPLDPNDINDRLSEMADEPSAMTSDGVTRNNQPIPDVIELHQHAAAADALAGTNQNGGPVSGWGCLRIARAKPGGPAS